MKLSQFSQSVAISTIISLLAIPVAWAEETDGDVIRVGNVLERLADASQSEYTFTLTNYTSVDMLEFYASPQTATDWEDNILGDNTIPANGGSTTVTLTGGRGCLYDFLAVFADSDKLEKYGINMCELETHTYYDS
ncbi:hypothetical protein [Leptothoe sp. PORK10 BA2]|uniref:hypothetical protein n=1 Tax=Leptothoe sp. PORK10 BA2 TaxID=3110254 RepID=UPI002B1EB81C|nr:hypothetical protein [Leptothoe sp. PORK10 BA2]MEA5466255.1 hypothetical protein [Leptothoe sp. PORK10 BA2]